MPLPPSAQYARNVKVVLQCGECLKWRVLYRKYSLKRDREELEQLVEDLDYTCGSIFADIEADEDSVLNSVFVKANLTCNSRIEIPYYTAGNHPLSAVKACLIIVGARPTASQLVACITIISALNKPRQKAA